MHLTLYHATDTKGARGIHRDQQFHFGKRGYAGPGIYFASSREGAMAHCFNGQSERATVIVICDVNLGRCLTTKKNTVDESLCSSRGYDSVRVSQTDTYAVYDPSRIVIQEFRTVRSDVCWPPPMPVSTSTGALRVIVAAIKASSENRVSAIDLGLLYSKHDGLRKAVGGLKSFCEAHAQLSWDGKTVSLSVSESMTSEKALTILVSTIQASGDKSLSAISLGLLYSEHNGLRKAVGGLKSFCEAHAELSWDGKTVSLPCDASVTSAKALQIMVSAIQASAETSLDVSSEMRPLYLKHPGLRDALGPGGLKGFCEGHAELSWNGSTVSLARKQELSAHAQEIQARQDVRQQRQMQLQQQEDSWQQRQMRVMQQEDKAQQQRQMHLQQQEAAENLRQWQRAQEEQLQTRKRQEEVAQQQRLCLKREAAVRLQQEDALRQAKMLSERRLWQLTQAEGRRTGEEEQMQLQRKQDLRSPWDILCAILGGIGAGIRCLRGD